MVMFIRSANKELQKMELLCGEKYIERICAGIHSQSSAAIVLKLFVLLK